MVLYNQVDYVFFIIENLTLFCQDDFENWF